MSGVVVEVRVKDGQEIKKGDPLCGKQHQFIAVQYSLSVRGSIVLSAMKVRNPILNFSRPLTISYSDGICCHRARLGAYQTSCRSRR